MLYLCEKFRCDFFRNILPKRRFPKRIAVFYLICQYVKDLAMPLFSAASALSFLFLIKYLPFTFQLPSIYLVILDFSNSIFLILPLPCSFYFVPFGLSLYKFCFALSALSTKIYMRLLRHLRLFALFLHSPVRNFYLLYI